MIQSKNIEIVMGYKYTIDRGVKFMNLWIDSVDKILLVLVTSTTFSSEENSAQALDFDLCNNVGRSPKFSKYEDPFNGSSLV